MEDISSKVALALNHIRIRGLGMVGRRVGEKGVRNIKTYSKRKQKLVVCLAKQMLLLVSVKLCVLELRICLRKVSSVPFGYVLLEFAGRLFGAMLRQHRTGGQGEGKKAPLLPHEETDHCWLGKLILGRMSGLRKRNGDINPQQKQCIICLRTLLTEILEIFQQTIEFFIGRSLFFSLNVLNGALFALFEFKGPYY